MRSKIMSQNTITINIANKSLNIACPIGEENALLAAAKELSTRFDKANKKNRGSSSAEQAMIMTALNLAYELLKSKDSSQNERFGLQSKIELLQSTAEQALMPADK